MCITEFQELPKSTWFTLETHRAVTLEMENTRKKHIRQQAISVFELTKGFTTEPNDTAMKTALELAGYVLELTTDAE